ncbi:YhbY family RNA-binding protein [Candidatus Woesearchaeota archaeon]|nr:YhbY family RNA-binding protein [Candidatus Woesearchaeota archaeon]
MDNGLDKSLLIARAKTLKPIMQVGKSGVTPGIVDEIKKQLKKRKLIKIKLLRSSFGDLDKKEIATLISETTNSEIINMVGFSLTLLRKG